MEKLMGHDLQTLLMPPPVCMAHDGMKMKDRRRGAVWHCPHAKIMIGNGRKRPPCLCRGVLDSARAALAKEQRAAETEGG